MPFLKWARRNLNSSYFHLLYSKFRRTLLAQLEDFCLEHFISQETLYNTPVFPASKSKGCGFLRVLHLAA